MAKAGLGPAQAPPIGALRHRVSVWEDVGTIRGPHNQRMPEWKQVAELWAAVSPLSGREFFESQKAQSSVSHRIMCRFLPGIKSTQEIRWKGRRFGINSVTNMDERDAWLEIMAVEVVS